MQDLQQGSGRVQHGDVIRLTRHEATHQQYSNAQIDDYRGDGLTHRAPLKMTIRAVFSHPIEQLKGTAGFGFWNAPFAPGSNRLRFPKAAWFFFGSPPLNLPLALGVPGDGFKAATLDATHWPFFAMLPAAPLGFLLMRIPTLYRRLWPIAQRAIRASEAPLTIDITQPHTYQIDWQTESVIFAVDDRVVHHSRYSPTGKMGFVAWIDNQYVVVTPQGNFVWGLVEESAPQWIEIEELRIEL
jgi:hypothetical protein